MAIKVVFPLCSSFCTRLLYNLDQVETCLAIYTDYNTFSPIKVILFINALIHRKEFKPDEYTCHTGKLLINCSLTSYRYYSFKIGFKSLPLLNIKFNRKSFVLLGSDSF